MDSSIDALVESSRVQFDEQAALLFRAMLDTEFRIVRDLVALGARAWQQTREHEFWPAHQVMHGLRRNIVVVPESKQPEIQSRWHLMQQALQTTRNEFKSHLQALASVQGFRGKVGSQTTSMPVWLQPEQPCLDIRYSTNDAFRSVLVGSGDIRAFIEKRAVRLEEAIRNSEKYRHKERIGALEERASKLSSELAQLDVLVNMYGAGLVARLSSGVATHIRLKFAAGSQTTTIQHMMLVTVRDGVEVRRAAKRNGSSQYGEPLMKLLDDTIHIYHPRRTPESVAGNASESASPRLRIASL
jgi:hypothetical protein